MKKLLIVFALVLVCFGLFAAKNELNVSVMPYSLQVMTSSNESVYKVVSDYGVGAEASYRRNFGSRGFFNEGGLSYSLYKLPEGRPDFGSLIAFIGVGYSKELSGSVSVSSHVAVGADICFYKGNVAEKLAVKTGFEFSFVQSEKAKAVLGVDSVFCFSEKDSVYYNTYRVVPKLGMSVGL